MAKHDFSSVLSLHLTSILLSLIFVGLRFYVKLRLVRNTGHDDYTILFSLVGLLVSHRCSNTSLPRTVYLGLRYCLFHHPMPW